MALPKLFVEVGAKIDGFDKAMGDVSKRLNAIDRDAGRAFSGFDKIGERLSSIGAGLTAAISLPLVGAGVAATKFATDFDSEMRKVTSLIGGATQKDFDNLSRQTLQLSKDLGVDAVNATKGLYEAISAGVPKENAVSFLAESSRLAIAGATDTGVAVDVLTTFMAAYGDKAKDTRKLSDSLFQAVNVGKFTFDELAKSIGPAAQQASSMGVRIEELLSSTATLSLSSGGLSEAVTQVKRAMQDLSDPTKEMKAALKGIGFESGTAAVKQLGLIGTLEALRKTTGDNTEAFKGLFGRIEGSTGALALTGENFKKATADLATFGKTADGVGPSQKALDERNKSTARQFEILSAKLNTVAIELGVELLPAVNSLLQASKPLVDLLGVIVKGFTALPDPIQAVALGLLGIAAAAGPVVFVAGQMLTAYALLKTSLVAVNGAAVVSATTAIPGLTTAMGAATLASTALSGALRAIPFVALAAGIAYVFDKLAQTKTAQENLTRASKEQSGTLEYLNNKYREQQVALGNVASTSASAKEKLLDFVQAMKSATGSGATAKAFDADRSSIEAFKKEIIESEKKTKLHNAALIELGLGHKIAGEGATALEKVVKKAETTYKAAVKSYDDGKISLEQLGVAQEKFIRAQDAADPERAAKRHEAAYFSMLDRYDHMATEIIKLAEQLKEADNQVAAGAQKNAADFGKAHEDMTKDVAKEVAIIVPLYQRIPAALLHLKESTVFTVKALAAQAELMSTAFGKGSALAIAALQKLQAAERDLVEESDKANGSIRKSAQDLATSYEIVGIKSVAQLQVIVKETQRAYELIVAAAGKSSVDALAAWIKMRQAEIDLARRSGQVIPDEQLKALERAQAQLDAALGKQVKSQSTWARQVSTIINDLAKDVARATVNLFKNLFDADGFNKKLREDSSKLREELALRSTAIADFRAETDAKIAGVESQYTKQLATETEALRASLAERTAEYEQYAEEVAASLETLRATEADRLAGELAELADKLNDKEGEYVKYAINVEKQEEEIRRTHAERLAEQLDGLRESLRERTQAYEDYVADANRSLSRIGEDLTESIEDDTRAANRRREDENKDYNRDIEKLNNDLLVAQRKGDKKAVKEIQRNLQQRTEDHELALRRIQEDLTDQVEDAKKRAADQTADLKTNLERRARDHGEFIAQNILEQRKVTEEHQVEQDRQIEKLRESLATRREELEQFRIATATATEQAIADSARRLGKEESDLAASLTARRAALDKYKGEVEGKLDQLTQYYKGKQTEEVAALNLEFQNKLKEYDTYRTGVETKLGELEQAHKGPLDRIKDMFVSVFDSASEAILRLASEAVIGSVFKKLGELTTSVLPDVASAIAGVLKLAGASAASTVPGALPGAIAAANPAAATGQIPGAGAAGSVAGAGLGGTIDVITGAISAAANVVQAIYNVRIEGTLNAIEGNTRAGKILIETLVNRANEFWPYLEGIHRAIVDVLVETLREVRNGLKTLFTVNLNLTDENQKALFSSLLTRVGTFDTTATDRLLNIFGRLGDVQSGIEGARKSIVETLVSVGGLLGGKLAAIENKLPSAVEKILGGGGLGGIAGAAGSFLGTILSGLVRGEGKTEDLIELNTRVAAIGITGPKGVIALQHEAYIPLNSINEFNKQKMDTFVNKILSWSESNPIAARIDRLYDLISERTNGLLEQMAAGGSLTTAAAGGPSINFRARLYIDGKEMNNVLVQSDETSGGAL